MFCSGLSETFTCYLWNQTKCTHLNYERVLKLKRASKLQNGPPPSAPHHGVAHRLQVQGARKPQEGPWSWLLSGLEPGSVTGQGQMVMETGCSPTTHSYAQSMSNDHEILKKFGN